MKPGAAIVEMYVGGLGFAVIARVTDHGGFDGAILGHPQQPYRAVPSANPYWDRKGRTFEDVDGYRVVLQNDAWSG